MVKETGMISPGGAWKRAIGCAALCVPLAALAGDWTLRMDGIGPLTLGLRYDAANRLVGGTLHREEWSSDTDACYYASIGNHPDVLLMFADGALRRVDVMREGVPTAEGIAVGDTVRRVFEVYPGVASEPDAYDDREHYLTVRSRNTGLALRFATHEGRIASFHAGRWKEVQYIEGCL
jgi:hypothetical protein